MAMSSSAVTKPTGTRPLKNMYIADVIATLDADTGNLVITHNLGAIPQMVYLEPITAASFLSQWTETPASRSTTQVTLVKNATATGSGAAPAQLRVYILRPATIVR